MVYPDNFEAKLGFDKIRQLVRGATLCPLGQARVDEMSFITDRNALQHELNLLDEMMRLLGEATQPLPTDGFFDLTDALKRVRIPGTFLETAELYDLMRSLRAIEALVRYLIGFEEGIPLLRREAEQVITFPDIIRRIDQTLTPNGEIRDNASPELARIRHEMAHTMSSIGRLLNGILRNAQADGLVEKDTTPAMRDGRLVIPIPPSSKRKLRGIVHDESATGKTLYVEPEEVVEANNRVRELEGEERQEIIRILTGLTNLIRPEVPSMLDSYSFLGLIDFVRAKARFAASIEGVVPRLSEHNITDWVQARHPLLFLRYKKHNDQLMRHAGTSTAELKTVVPLDIALDHRKQRIVLISGPNAGGKSVCLETLGLVQYMLQHGLPVPLNENSECAIYSNIFVDIGDEQSIDNDLSTYSSHLQNMKFFLRNANRTSLVLIDEFGSGTEPQIGGAIAQAILGKLNNSQVNGVITTHFTNLKLFADETPGIVNGAMLYDRGGMRPLFRLEVGRPGSSFAIEIAHKIGLPLDVIDEAKRIVGSDYVNMDKYLQDISRDKRYWEQKRQKIHQQEKELEEKSAAYDEKTAELKAKRQEVMQKARDEASSLLKEANARIERTIKEIKEAQAEKEATRKIRQEHSRFVEKKINAKDKAATSAAQGSSSTNAPASTPSQPIEVGCHVRIKGQQTLGEVIAISGRQCQVAFGMIKSSIDMSRLERVSRNQQKKEEAQKYTFLNSGGTHDPSVSDEIRQRRLSFKQELDIRGMRAEEALQRLMYYMDDAQLLGIAQVRILHGTGTGALRTVVRQYLSTRACVSNFHDEHVQMGGAGITVAELE